MTARCVMVLGTTSGAGKSWLVTALCRYYARQGFKVAPFKAQNMSNNARVVEQGEIGSAQYFQALAAGVAPAVQHNPLLLKPEGDTRSQVVLMGQVDAALTRMPWRGRSKKVWPQIAAALDQLRADNDIIVIEGAGSPAEINLRDSDIVNMHVALHCQHNGSPTQCLLVTDIDRGGAFAHLYGTWALLSPAEQALISGFVLNKFRGDASLLAPAPEQLQALTGIPVVATLPMWRQHGLPEEDGLFDEGAIEHEASTEASTEDATAGASVGVTGASMPVPPLRIGIIAWPRISNLDEFQPLKNRPGVSLRWVRDVAAMAQLDWIILPGSKQTSADLAWLRAQSLDQAIIAHAEAGRAVLGICGGLQMLGTALHDPYGVDGNAQGLGLLALDTVFDSDKTVQRTQAHFGAVQGDWKMFSQLAVTGYEIHHGQTVASGGAAAVGTKADAKAKANPRAHASAILHDAGGNALGWQNAAGNVLGVYLHGMFEDPVVSAALLGGAGMTLDAVFDGLANFIALHFSTGTLDALITSTETVLPSLDASST